MKNLNIYYLSEDYINFLRKFDKRVAYNKTQKRPYVGIVYTYNGINYFVPLHSPKEKHLSINSKAIDIFKIDGGRLGVININNMIPAPNFVLTEVLPTINDEKYRNLLINQLTYINSNKRELFSKIITFQKRFRKGHLSQSIIERTCDFLLLEEKMKEYEIEHKGV